MECATGHGCFVFNLLTEKKLKIIESRSFIVHCHFRSETIVISQRSTSFNLSTATVAAAAAWYLVNILIQILD